MYSSQNHPRQLSTPVYRKRNLFLSLLLTSLLEQYLSSRTPEYLPRDGTSKVLKQDQTSIRLPLTIN